MEWWTEKLPDLPNLAKLSLQALAIPVSSASVEGSFAIYRQDVLRDNRKNIKPENIERIQMLAYNKRM